MPLSPRLLRPANTFTPKSLPGLALWLDASDGSSLFQNSDGTVPAVNSGDPVGYWRDRSGNGRHATQATGANRPTAGSIGSRTALRLGASGAVSRLSLGNLAAAFPSAGNVFVAFQPNGDSQYTLYSTRNNDDTYANTSTSLWGTWINTRASVTSSRPSSGVHVANLYGTTGSFSVIEDGALIHSSSALIWEPGDDHNIGSRSASAAGQTPLDGWIGEVIAYNRAISASERRRLEAYLANRWGITLAPQVSNADAQDWISRVYANGGTVSASTASAVNTFCDSIDAAGIRDRFYRLNLFCGGTSGTTAGLNACLVPLYRGPSLGGTQYGNTTDTNVGPFVSGDYVEAGASGGLKGNGTSKWLKTGLTTAALPQLTTGHLSAYLMAGVGDAAAYGLIGSFASGFAGTNSYFIQHNSGNFQMGYGNTAPGFTVNTIGGNGFLMASRESSVSLKALRNGVQFGSTVNTAGSGLSNNGSGFGVYALSDGVGGLNFADVRMGAYSIGAGMSGAQSLAFYTAMQAFQAALGRNV